MNAFLTTRIALPVLAVLAGAPLTARADHYDRTFDSIERYADISADRARHVYTDIIHDVHDRLLRAEMMTEAQRVMVGFAQVRVLARQERVDRMASEIHRVSAALRRLDHLVHDAEHDELHAHHGRGPDVHHIHDMVGDLTKRAAIIDDLVHSLQVPAAGRYESGYRGPRAVYSRGRTGYDDSPSGIYIGGRGFGIRIPTR